MKNTLIACFVLLSILSCRKARTTEYAGRVVDAQGDPLSGVTISYTYRAGAGSISDGEDVTRTLATSASDGSFSGKITLRKKEYLETLNAYSAGPPVRNIQVRIPPSDSLKIMRIVMR